MINKKVWSPIIPSLKRSIFDLVFPKTEYDFHVKNVSQVTQVCRLSTMIKILHQLLAHNRYLLKYVPKATLLQTYKTDWALFRIVHQN